MPRRPRVLLEGGLYHVYNRFARGESVFGDPEEAIEFVELARVVKKRDGLTVFAWALLSNHFHMAVRTSAVPLSRTLRRLQGGYSKAFNRRWRRSGPLWQSRYQAKLVEDQRYFEQLMVYIHLNPVRAGLVGDPGDYVFSGHRELLGKVSSPLVDMDEALVCFGESIRSARRQYQSRIRAALKDEEWSGHLLPPPRQLTRDDRLEAEEGHAYVDVLGRSTGLERPRLEAADFVDLACTVLATDVLRLASARRDPATARLRMLVATVGIERWGQRAGALAKVLDKHSDGVSRWVSRGAALRGEDPAFAKEAAELDEELSRQTLDRLRQGRQ
jgi:putative transposase